MRLPSLLLPHLQYLFSLFLAGKVSVKQSESCCLNVLLPPLLPLSPTSLQRLPLQIKNRLKHEPVSLSLPSQRVDRFNDDIANIVGGTRKVRGWEGGGLLVAIRANVRPYYVSTMCLP